MPLLTDISKKLRELISQGSQFVQQNPSPTRYVAQQIQQRASPPIQQFQQRVAQPMVNTFNTNVQMMRHPIKSLTTETPAARFLFEKIGGPASGLTNPYENIQGPPTVGKYLNANANAAMPGLIPMAGGVARGYNLMKGLGTTGIFSALGHLGGEKPQDIYTPERVLMTTLLGGLTETPGIKTGLPTRLSGGKVKISSGEKLGYRGQAMGSEQGDITFFTDNPQKAKEYARVNTPIAGQSKVITKDLSTLKFKEVTKKTMLDAQSDPMIRTKYDGIKFKDGNTTNYGVFTKSQTPTEVVGGKKVTTPKVKITGNVPTREEVAATLDTKINDLMESTAGYKTETPLVTGSKGASGYTRLLRNVQGKIETGIEKGLASQNSLIRTASSVLHGFFKELGTSPQRTQANLSLKGKLSTARSQPYDVMQSLYDALGPKAETSKARIDAVLDPAASKIKVTYNNLTPTEKAVYSLIRQTFDLVHDMSYANGDISPSTYKKNLGNYSARLYTQYEIPPEINKFINQSFKKINTDIYRSKGNINQWKIDNKLNDPIYAAGKRLSQVESNRAIRQYTDFIASQSHLVSQVERKGFTKLSDSPAYGKLSGKYIVNSAAEELKGFFFANEGLNKLYDVFKIYDRLPPRQLYKKILTVFNPTTNVGNITSDNVFGFLVGVDPITLNYNLARLKANPKEFKQYVNYLTDRGIVGTDITRTDFVSKIGSIDELGGVTKSNLLEKGSAKVQGFYGGTDDAYKVAALKSLIDKGYNLEEATRLVSDGFQNYASVGKFYDVASKVPIVGQPFIKFQGDLIRIVKNAAVNRPLHLITFLATLKAISLLASKASGETDEQRVARENRFGANKIPGLDISLQWQTPIGEINVARYISPFYTTNLNESATTQALNKLLPGVPEIARDKTGKLDIPGTIALNANDPLLAPLVQLAVDRDFRNKFISDPKASPYFGSDLPTEEQLKNRVIWLARAYTPPQINSLIDVRSAAMGQPNMYGQQQTVPQAIARVAGVKIQQATPSVIQQGQEKSAYFEAQGPAFNKLKANEKAAVLSIPKQDPDDTQAKIDKYITLLQNPNVYNYLKEIAINQVNGDMSKVDPLYTYPYADVRKYMTYQSFGGSDYGNPDAKALYKAEPVIGEISQARSAYYKANPIEGSDYSTSRPIASAYAQQQMDLGNWNDPEVQAYLTANTAWKNMQREKAGLPPLTESFMWPEKKKKVTMKKISAPGKVTIRSLTKGRTPTVKIKKFKPKKLAAKNIKLGFATQSKTYKITQPPKIKGLTQGVKLV